VKTAHRSSRRFLFGNAVSPAAALVFALGMGTGAAGCGVQEHGSQQSAPAGTGGQGVPAGSGGSGTGSGGSSTGSGGSSAGTGGASSPGSGGSSSPGSGGSSSPGSGGRAAGSGGNQPGPDGGAPADAAAEMPPLSGVTINIAGTQVPREKAIAFVHFGHSNMRGQASSPSSLRPYFYDTQPGLWIYQGGGTFVLAKEPTAPENSRSTLAGPGMALLKTAAAAAPADYHFISIGRGNGASPSSDFMKGGLIYSAFMDRAMELKGKVTFGGIFMMLGITDRHLPTAEQPGFPMRIQQIIASIRADLGEPNLPVLACDYEMEATGTLAPTGAIGSALRPLIQMLPGLIPNLVLVPTNGIGMQDDHHFNFAGQQTWGQRAIMIMQERGWFRWAK
jgi:hypothetical protein